MATWQIANPEYMRDTVGDKVIPYYSFNIRNGPDYGDKPITTAADIKDSLLSVITPATLSNYLLGLYSAFLNIHGKRFAKPYTPTQLIKITSHIAETTISDEDEYEWTLMPHSIHVKNGAFHLKWKAAAQPIKIELSEEAPEHPEQKSPALDLPVIQEVEIAAVAEENTSNGFLRLTSNSQLRDKRLLEEARIRAKWAQYKAEKAIAKYVERYGELDDELLSEDDESGSESDSE
jgi:hypothetical protein